VSREGVNPSACPYQRFRFSFIEINPKNERTHESAESDAGFNQSSQTVLGASSARRKAKTGSSIPTCRSKL
jgi:hypothetical protein